MLKDIELEDIASHRIGNKFVKKERIKKELVLLWGPVHLGQAEKKMSKSVLSRPRSSK